jgi:hypothetical protein
MKLRSALMEYHEQGCTNYLKDWAPAQNSRRHKGDTKQFHTEDPYILGATIKKIRRRSELEPRICTPLITNTDARSDFNRRSADMRGRLKYLRSQFRPLQLTNHIFNQLRFIYRCRQLGLYSVEWYTGLVNNKQERIRKEGSWPVEVLCYPSICMEQLGGGGGRTWKDLGHYDPAHAGIRTTDQQDRSHKLYRLRQCVWYDDDPGLAAASCK